MYMCEYTFEYTQTHMSCPGLEDKLPGYKLPVIKLTIYGDLMYSMVIIANNTASYNWKGVRRVDLKCSWCKKEMLFVWRDGGAN